MKVIMRIIGAICIVIGGALIALGMRDSFGAARTQKPVVYEWTVGPDERVGNVEIDLQTNSGAEMESDYVYEPIDDVRPTVDEELATETVVNNDITISDETDADEATDGMRVIPIDGAETATEGGVEE